jgi:hypothetical protein
VARSARFLTKAEALGAAGFIESPLSLKLLRKAVPGGDDWPTTRYDLFETAIRRLVHALLSAGAGIVRWAVIEPLHASVPHQQAW